MTQALIAAALAMACTSNTKQPTAEGGKRGGGDDTGTVHTGDDTGRKDVPCEAAPPSVEIGTGDTTFESLVEAEPVVMVHGPQGGWHMLGSVRTHNMHNIIEVHYTVTDMESGVRVSDNNYRVAVVQDGECTGYYPGMYGYIDVAELVTEFATRPPEVLGYHIVELRMAVKDYEGREAEASILVTAQPDPADLPGAEADTGLP